MKTIFLHIFLIITLLITSALNAQSISRVTELHVLINSEGSKDFVRHTYKIPFGNNEIPNDLKNVLDKIKVDEEDKTVSASFMNGMVKTILYVPCRYNTKSLPGENECEDMIKISTNGNTYRFYATSYWLGKDLHKAKYDPNVGKDIPYDSRDKCVSKKLDEKLKSIAAKNGFENFGFVFKDKNSSDTFLEIRLFETTECKSCSTHNHKITGKGLNIHFDKDYNVLSIKKSNKKRNAKPFD